MSDFVTMPDGRTVLQSEAAAIEAWIGFVSSLVVMYEAHTDKLVEATRELGRVAQEQFPQLESGDPVRLAVADLDGLMDDFDPKFVNAYVGFTGTVLFCCVDGPGVAAGVLAEQIIVLRDAAWDEVEGGENA